MRERILVCGSRYAAKGGRSADLEHAIRSRLSTLGPPGDVIHGCSGDVDMTAHRVANRMGFKVTPYRALWHRYGKAAGPIRNQQMIDTKPTIVLAFWDGESTGTGGTIELARERDIRLWIVGWV